MEKPNLWRTRWAAIGAAVAVSLGAGGLLVAQAAPGTAESTIVSVTPERILDTRDPVNLGLAGPLVSPVAQRLQVTGAVATATGMKTVVPAGATGVLLNVTSVGSTAGGFISVRPGDATGAPTTSSLNFSAGDVVPNSVQVALPTAGANAGKIDITFDAFGVAGPTTDVLIDVVGYTTNAGLQQLVADVAAKANAADVYSKAEVDQKFATTGTLRVGAAAFVAESDGAWADGCFRRTTGDNVVRAGLQLPAGVRITKLTALMFDNGIGVGVTRLRRLTSSGTSTLASVTSGNFLLSEASVNLLVPEVVQPGEYFNVEYDAPGGDAGHQICGVAIDYTIPVGQSVLLESGTDGSTATDVGTPGVD